MKETRREDIMCGGERLLVALSYALIPLAMLIGLTMQTAQAQQRTVIRNGQIVTTTSEQTQAEDEQEAIEPTEAIETTASEETITEASEPTEAKIVADTTANVKSLGEILDGTANQATSKRALRAEQKSMANREDKKRLFSDSMSISAMTWKALAFPGYGQIYNKQYWKLPILYGTVGAGLGLFIKENQRYKPLKAQYDELSIDLYRNEELNSVQEAMIRSNTRRQLYLGATVASFIYFLGDAAVNYSTNDVSDVKRATTLAMICPGAGQVYNQSYWKLPIVVGGFATLIYVVDWNNRGYKRFQTAYRLTYNYENGDYEEPIDEFAGQYSASYLKSIRNTYRRARDLSIIMLAGLYILQVIDAHVDAHFKDYDISDNLSVSVEPMVGSVYSPTTGRVSPSYGFNVAARF